MGEIIDRVAKAIRQKSFELRDSSTITWEEIAVHVIKAMREPTSAMIEAAEAGDDKGSNIFDEPYNPLPHDVAWRLMIDAILKE